MTLKQRRLLYSFFIFLFLSITPLIWLYAAGYKLGGGFNIQKTGMLIIDSEPPGANIYLDDKIQQNIFKKYFTAKPGQINTPAKIKNLLPREYDVRLELDGYWPWQKKLKIEGGQSTFAEDIVLFKNCLPQMMFSGDWQSLSLSPSQNYIAAFGADNINIIRLDNESEQKWPVSTSFSASTSEAQIHWSLNEQKILYGLLTLNIKNGLTLNLASILGQNIKNIRWYNNDNSLLYLIDGRIYEYRLDSKTNHRITNKQNIQSFMVKGEHLYFTAQDNGRLALFGWHLAEKQIQKKIGLPNSEYSFKETKGPYLNVFDTVHDILYLIEPFSPYRPLRDTINNVTQSAWINDNRLLFANEFEVWIYQANSYSQTILTRISTPIKRIFWHSNDNYIIYTTNSGVNTIELDDRDRYNVTKLLEFKNISSIELNKTGDTLYLLAQIGQQKGVYKLTIQ